MQVWVNSDHRIVGGEDLTERVQGVLEGRLERFSGRIARVEAHLGDLDSAELGERDTRKTLRCTIEARAGGLKPIAVSHEAPTLAEAIHVAADKLERALDRAFAKLEPTGSLETRPAATEGELHRQVARVETRQALERTEADR